MDSKGHMVPTKSENKEINRFDFEQIVLEKGVFSNIFEKDIRRVYIYKKSERIAKALYMIAPAFKDAKALRERIQRISVEIIDASILPPSEAKDALARELLALSSVLAMARTAGMLSHMNADIIMREAHNLLAEVAAYEEPKVSLPDVQSIASLAKSLPVEARMQTRSVTPSVRPMESRNVKGQSHNGHKSDYKDKNRRKETILSILSSKGPSYIKDLSTLIREVSEKTIQRELQALVAEGRVTRTGKRRWTMYTAAGQGSVSLVQNGGARPQIDETVSVG